MKIRTCIFNLFIVIFIGLSVMVPSEIYAGIGVNFHQTQIKAMSERGSEFIFKGLSKLYESMAFIEQKEFGKGKSMWENSVTDFKEAIGIYYEINSITPDKSIILEGVQFNQIGLIAKDFYSYRKEFPRTMKNLTQIAYDELGSFLTFISGNNFTSNMNINRKIARDLYERINRLTTLGISISELSSSQSKNF